MTQSVSHANSALRRGIDYGLWVGVIQLRRYPCLYTLHPTLYTISASAPASNLSPLALSPHLPAKGSVLTQMPQADAGAVRSSAGQNRNLDRREINAVNGSKNIAGRSKNIEIYLVQLSDEG